MSSRIIRFLLVMMVLVSFGAVQAQDEDPYATIPDTLVFDLNVQVAYSDSDVFWRFTWEAENPGYYHDYLVYEDGTWKRYGDSGGGGSDPLGLREERVTFMLEPGTVRGFGTQGCYVGCHDGTTTLSNEVSAEIIAASNYTLSSDEVRKFIPASRIAEGEWWDVTWDEVKTPEEIQALREAGVFLDLWHWRGHRSNPIGYSDNQYVMEYRNNDGSRAPFKTNFVSDAGTPEMMYNPEITGFYALNWDKLIAGEYTFDDYYYISTDIAVPFDPEHEWQNGDTIPRRLLREPDENSGSILADGVWENGVWTVELRRSLAEVDPTVSHQLVEGRVYNAAFAVHNNATGSRWHHISNPYSIGIGTPADITAVKIAGNTPDWSAISAVTVPVRYPGETTWEWLTSDAHPGAEEVRADSRSCVSCHGDSNTAMLKLAQAAVNYEVTGGAVSGNWWLTLVAVLALVGGGTFTMLNLFGKKES